MSADTVMWFLAGLVAGTMHACLLWRVARSPEQGAMAMPLRLLGVAALFASAALLGGLWAAVCGWASGFCLSVISLYLWKTR